MQTALVGVFTGVHETVVDITGRCADFLHSVAAVDGLLSVFLPHASAGLAVLETGAGSDADLLEVLRQLLPAAGHWQHQHGSPGHGRDHVLPALLTTSVVIPVVAGEMMLGTWQSVCIVDTNSQNRDRQVRLSFIPG